MSSQAKKAAEELSFEKAMERLEKIVNEMESGKMLLEDLLVRYEEGMKLVKTCQERLARAEQRIQIINRNQAGKAMVEEFEPANEAATTDIKDKRDHDEVRLF